jgi:hypothetical protein
MAEMTDKEVRAVARQLAAQAVVAATSKIDREQLEVRVAQCSGFVKMMTGVANNCAIQIATQCWNKVADIRDKDSYRERPRQPHPGCKHKAKQTFRQFFTEWHQMESVLLHPSAGQARFFHVDDMTPKVRKKYGAMTDAQYFEFWRGTGALAYQRSQPLIGSLHNKFRLSLERHGVANAQLTAWSMVADAALQMAVETWQRTMRQCYDEVPQMTHEWLDNLWRPFSPRRPAETWRRALLLLAPECNAYKLDGDEERNIALGLAQLRELWTSAELNYDSTIRAVEDFDEDVFRTRGEAKKARRELTEMRNDTLQELEEKARKRRLG